MKILNSMNMTWAMSIMLVVCGLWLAGCAQTGGQLPDDAAAPGDGAGADGQTSGLEEDEGLQLDPLNDPDSPLAERVIYFEYDSSQVGPEYNDLIDVHGEYLANHPEQRIRLEGHADERGTREYNLGLGEQRAQSVRRMLLLQGASPDQLVVISYGEERSDAFGHDEQAWSQNRRVELVYLIN